MSFEKSITTSIIAYIKKIGGQAEKVKGDSSASGRPDINACYKGRCLRIEVKTPDNRNTTSKKQDINLKRWTHAGAICMTVYSRDAVKHFIRKTNKSPYEAGIISYEEKNGCVSKCFIPILVRERK